MHLVSITESGFDGVVTINGSWGLGEAIVAGLVNPDEYVVFKHKLDEGFSSIIDKKLGQKQQKVVYSLSGNDTAIISVEKEKQNIFCMNDDEIVKLAKWVIIIEKYYSDLYKNYGRYRMGN